MKIKVQKLLMGVFFAMCVFSLPAAAATNNTLSGTYFAGEMRTGTEFTTSLIQYDCDGAGALTRQILYQSGAGATGGADTYSIGTDGMMSTGNMKGVVSSDGVYFVINSTTTSNSPYMQFAVKQSSGMANKKMTGRYAMMIYTLSDPAGISGMFEAVCDGSGNMTATLMAPAAAQTSLPDVIAGVYSVSGNGRMTFTQTGLTVPDQGVISSDGETFMLVGVNTSQGVQPFLAVGIRQDSGMSLSDFNGNYYYNEFLAESDGTEFTGYVTNTSADGNGKLNIKEIYDTCGCPLVSRSLNFTMNADGRIAIDSNRTGALASGKNIFALVGYNYASGAFLGIGILKSTEETDEGETDSSGGGGGGCFVKTAGE